MSHQPKTAAKAAKHIATKMHNAETMVNTLTNVKCNLPVMVSHLKVSSNEVYLNYADIFSHFALELPE